jgi:hypothetical protein
MQVNQLSFLTDLLGKPLNISKPSEPHKGDLNTSMTSETRNHSSEPIKVPGKATKPKSVLSLADLICMILGLYD